MRENKITKQNIKNARKTPGKTEGQAVLSGLKLLRLKVRKVKRQTNTQTETGGRGKKSDIDPCPVQESVASLSLRAGLQHK